MVFINTFVNTVINKSANKLVQPFQFMVIIGGLHYFEVIDVLAISERVFLPFIQNIGFFIIPIVVLLVLAVYSLSSKKFVSGQGLEMKKAAGKTENIAFLNKYGTWELWINNDIRLIKKSKAAKSALIGGFIPFLGFLCKVYLVYAGFLGFFVGTCLAKVPTWDSSYYPLMMTQIFP